MQIDKLVRFLRVANLFSIPSIYSIILWVTLDTNRSGIRATKGRFDSMNVFKSCGFLAILIATIATTSAQAADVKDQYTAGFELGIGVGQGNLRISDADIGTASESETGFNIFGGYRFDRYFSVEAGYLDGGKFTASGTDGTDVINASVHLQAAQLSGVGTLPLGDYFGLFGRIGADHWWATANASDNSGSASDTGSRTSFLWGAGAVAFVDGAQLRLEYQQSNDNEQVGAGFSDVDLRHRYISASIVWLF